MLIPKQFLGITKRRLQNASTRRKLYYAEHIPPTSSTPFPLMTIPSSQSSQHQVPSTSLNHRQRTRIKSLEKVEESQVDGILDKLINAMKEEAPIERIQQGIIHHQKLNFKSLPVKLQKQLTSTSDPHVKLNCLLDFNQPLKVKVEFVESVLLELGVDEVVSICDFLSEELFFKLVKFQLTHKNFDKVSNIIQEVVINNSSMVDLDRLGFIIFDSFKRDHDLKFGFMDLMKSLYQLLGTQETIFKYIYTTLTNNGNTLLVNGVDYDFDDIWKMIQLSQIIDDVPDIKELPEPYWKTSYKYIDLQLGMKCFEHGELERGFAHLKRTKIIGEDGIIYRIIQSGCLNKSNNQLSEGFLSKPTNLESKVLRVIVSNPVRNISPMDIDVLRGFTKNLNTLNNTMKELVNNAAIFELKNMYLKKMLVMKNLRFATNMIRNNLDQIYKFDTSLLAKVFSLNDKDEELLSLVLPKLPVLVRTCFISSLLKQQLKCVSNEKESTIPELQFQQIEWILKTINYQLTDWNFRTISTLLARLPLNLQKQIIYKIKGPPFSTYINYLSQGIPLSSTLIPTLVNSEKCRTKSELYSLANYIAQSCSTEETIYILSNIKRKNRYESLHLKITIALSKCGELDKIQQIMEMEPYDRSQFYFNQVLLSRGKTPLNYSGAYVAKPIELIKLQTLERLLDEGRLGFSSSLRKNVGHLMQKNKFDQNMAILLLRKVVTKIKNNGEMRETDRLRWSVEVCVRYGVPHNVIAEVLHS